LKTSENSYVEDSYKNTCTNQLSDIAHGRPPFRRYARGSTTSVRRLIRRPPRVFERKAYHRVCVAHDLPCGEPGCASGDPVSDDELKLRSVPPHAYGCLKYCLYELVFTVHVEPLWGVPRPLTRARTRNAHCNLVVEVASEAVAYVARDRGHRVAKYCAEKQQSPAKLVPTSVRSFLGFDVPTTMRTARIAAAHMRFR
jgi:hypothetical protein